jgi:Ulp1 family protease
MFTEHCNVVISYSSQYIDVRHNMECSRPFLWKKWRVKLCWDYPQQTNGYDCKVFVMKDDTARFRAEIVLELMPVQLRTSVSAAIVSTSAKNKTQIPTLVPTTSAETVNLTRKQITNYLI